MERIWMQTEPMIMPVTSRDVWLASFRIRPWVHPTPLVLSQGLSEKAGCPVYLKYEHIHEMGAFKVRGAASKILSLRPAERKRGVVTYSTGNHGLAVSYMGKRLGVPVTVVISRRVPPVKIENLRRYGAHVLIEGDSQTEAGVRARQLVDDQGLTMIEPFDDAEVIAGQGTVGLEILEELPSVRTVLVPLSGGGLLSGILVMLKANLPDVRVIGLSMERAAVMYQSLKAGHPVDCPEEPTLADSLQGGIGLDNRYTWPIVSHLADDVILVSEEAIGRSMGFMLKHHRMALEGAAVVGVAGILEGLVSELEGPVAVVLTGQNVDLAMVLNASSVSAGEDREAF